MYPPQYTHASIGGGTPPHPPTKTTPTFSIALHAGLASSWTANADLQKEVLTFLEDLGRESGWSLAEGKTAGEVCRDVIAELENKGFFNAGVGGKGHEIDAVMVVGPQRGETARWGAVTRVCRVKNPVCGAYAVLEDDRYGLLDGGKADEFAQIQGLQLVQSGYFGTGVGSGWQQRDSMGGKGGGVYLEGVGCVVRDSFGGLAAGCSFAGMEKRDSKGKMDYSLVFAGLSVDSQCAVVCTGALADLVDEKVASTVCELSKSTSIKDAISEVLLTMTKKALQPCGIIAVDSTGAISTQSTGRVFLTATCSSFQSCKVTIIGNTNPVTPDHIFHHDTQLTAGLTHYPIVKGHTLITLHKNLTDLPFPAFSSALHTTRDIAITLCANIKATSCGLASNGSNTFSLLPFHHPSYYTIHTSEFHSYYPGYLTTKSGPRQETATLDYFKTLITSVSKLENSKPPVLSMDPDSYYRVWEDKHHVAYLDPYGSVYGATILVPRKGLKGGVFALGVKEYGGIVKATYTVAQILSSALGATCGVFFEGGCVCVRLVPVWSEEEGGLGFVKVGCEPGEYYEMYPGFLTTELGVGRYEEVVGLRGELRGEVVGRKGRWWCRRVGWLGGSRWWVVFV